jgi:hypothetical protein
MITRRAYGWQSENHPTRAKWRSSMSARRSVLQNELDAADIVRDAMLRQLTSQMSVAHGFMLFRALVNALSLASIVTCLRAYGLSRIMPTSSVVLSRKFIP